MTIAFTHNGQQITCEARNVSGSGQGLWHLMENNYFRGQIIETVNGWVYHGIYEEHYSDIVEQLKMHIMKEEEEYNKRVADFIEELDSLCKKYNLSISHEDRQGNFIIEEYDENNSAKNWI